MGEAFRLDEDARRQIDEHLDSIEEVLRSTGMTRSERQNILDDVETQIVEMLTARTQETPTVEDAKAVIAELDPPESYAPEGQGEQQEEQGSILPFFAPTKKWTVDKTALGFSIGGIVVPVLLALIGRVVLGGRAMSLSVCFPLVLEATGLILGIATWHKPLGKAATILSACILILVIVFIGLASA
jgi:hypothetical protein